MYKWFVLGCMAVLMWSCVPTKAEAARCPKGQIYRPSMGVCQLKGRSVYVKRVKKQRRHVARAYVPRMRIPRPTTVPSLLCDELCQLHINLHTWAQRNKGTFQ